MGPAARHGGGHRHGLDAAQYRSDGSGRGHHHRAHSDHSRIRLDHGELVRVRPGHQSARDLYLELMDGGSADPVAGDGDEPAPLRRPQLRCAGLYRRRERAGFHRGVILAAAARETRRGRRHHGDALRRNHRVPDIHLRALPGDRERRARRRRPASPERRQRTLHDLFRSDVQALPAGAIEGRTLHAVGKEDGANRSARPRTKELRNMKTKLWKYGIPLIALALALAEIVVHAQSNIHTGTATWTPSVDDSTAACTAPSVCSQSIYRAPTSCAAVPLNLVKYASVASNATTYVDVAPLFGNSCYAGSFVINGVESLDSHTSGGSLSPAPPTNLTVTVK